MPESHASHKLIYLESLRGLAALAVTIFHLILAFYPELDLHPLQVPPHLWVVDFAMLIFYGSYAVRLFFFLSGFVLAISYFRKPLSSTLTSAALKRYPRLMIPVLAAIIFAWLIQELYGYPTGEVVKLAQQPNFTMLTGVYLNHISLIEALKQGTYYSFFNLDGSRSLDGVLWTMPVELAGSFLVFSFLALFGHLRGRLVLYLIAALVLRYLDQYFMLDFLCGMALSDLFVLHQKSHRKIEIPLSVSLLMVLVGLALGGIATCRPNGIPFFYMPSLFNIPTLASLLIVGAAIFSSRLQFLLEHSVIAFFGKISFPLYLVHFPIICSLGCGSYLYLRHVSFSHGTASLVASLLVLTSSIIISWGAYYAVELPSIRLAGHFAKLFYSRKSIHS